MEKNEEKREGKKEGETKVERGEMKTRRETALICLL